MKDAWDTKREILVKSGSFAIEQLSEALSKAAVSNKVSDELPQTALRLCAEQVKFLTNRGILCTFFLYRSNILLQCGGHTYVYILQLSSSYDPEHGGFGTAPKFPRPVEVQLMMYWSKKLSEAGKTGEANSSLDMVYSTLKYMARGGIHDHVGGGFHRYSVDECWHGEFLLIVGLESLLEWSIKICFTLGEG